MSARRKRTELLVPRRRNVHFAAIGKNSNENETRTIIPAASCRTITGVDPELLWVPATTASTVRARVSVRTVAPTVEATAGFRARPASRTSGYVMSVLDAARA